MKFQELLEINGINPERTRLIRHTKKEGLEEIMAKGYFEIYQSVQNASTFRDCEFLMSFIGVEGTNAKFYGCYKIINHKPFQIEKLPSDYPCEHRGRELIFSKMEKTSILEELVNRLVIDWGNPVSYYQNATNQKEVSYILPIVSPFEFSSYDKIILSYKNLKIIVDESANHKIWKDKLSTVSGVYLITDTKTGKHYVGSATSNDNGIWGRWSNYAKTKHGGNFHLKALIDDDNDYCYNFQFSILDVFPIKRDRAEVLEYEQLYKRKFCSVEFGLNGN